MLLFWIISDSLCFIMSLHSDDLLKQFAFGKAVGNSFNLAAIRQTGKNKITTISVRSVYWLSSYYVCCPNSVKLKVPSSAFVYERLLHE